MTSSSPVFVAGTTAVLGPDSRSASPIVPGSSLPLVSGRNSARTPLASADPPKMAIGSQAEAEDSEATYGLRMAPTLAYEID